MELEDKIIALISKVDRLCDLIVKKQRSARHSEYELMDSEQLISFMNISKRTLQTWRDEGIITFSQVGQKIYYRKKDIEELLTRKKVKGS